METSFVEFLWVLLLGSLLGLELIGKVPPTLHTPLMSGANAISGITVLAALTLTTGLAIAVLLPADQRILLPLLLGFALICYLALVDTQPRRNRLMAAAAGAVCRNSQRQTQQGDHGHQVGDVEFSHNGTGVLFSCC